MKSHTEPVHHKHTRKRVHQNLEQYPNPVRWKYILDKSIYLVGIAGPIMTIPQLYKIWIEQNASGVSALSWSSYALFAAIWILYGIVHKERPIIFTYSMWLLVEVLIVIGVLIYR